MCSAYAERDVPFGRDVCFASDVRFAREEAEHITSLCDEGAIHHCAIALHHFGAADTSLKNVRVRSHTLKRQKYLFVVHRQKIKHLLKQVLYFYPIRRTGM